jgi:hypothetical protein
MPAKILLSPEGKHGSAIVGTKGRLRIVDQPKRCRGYQNCCYCKRCLAREALSLNRPPVATCSCDRPVSVAGEDCFKCGKPAARQAA